MTTLVPSMAQQPSEEPAPPTRQCIRYLFYKILRSWRRDVGAAERARARAELVEVLEQFADQLPVLRAYSTLGTRADADFMLWMVSERLEDFQTLHSAVLRTAIGAHFETPYSYLAMTRRSQYIDRHEHADGQGEGRRTRGRPIDRKYLFGYPMGKKRPWYRLST